MARMLDVLEIFLTYHGHTYLRLDGATPVTKRQVSTLHCTTLQIQTTYVNYMYMYLTLLSIHTHVLYNFKRVSKLILMNN